MTAETLRQVFDSLYLLMLGAWAGATVVVLRLVPSAPAENRPDSTWNPHLLECFYRLGATCGALALPAAACARLAFPEYRSPWFGLQALVLIAMTLPMFAGASRPSPRRATAASPTLQAIRARLAILLVLLAALAVFQALRPLPRTRGIIEPHPGAPSASIPPSLPTSAGETPRGGLH